MSKIFLLVANREIDKVWFTYGIIIEHFFAMRVHLMRERTKVFVYHGGIKLVADHLEKGVEFREMQPFVQHTVGEFGGFDLRMPGSQCIGISFGGKIGTLLDKRFVDRQFWKTFV